MPKRRLVKVLVRHKRLLGRLVLVRIDIWIICISRFLSVLLFLSYNVLYHMYLTGIWGRFRSGIDQVKGSMFERGDPNQQLGPGGYPLSQYGGTYIISRRVSCILLLDVIFATFALTT